MTTYAIEIRSRSGKKLPGCVGSRTEISAYSTAELKRWLADLAKNPDLEVTHRRIDPKVTEQGLAAARRQGLIP